MTLKLAAFQHFCARFADAFLTSLSPLTYERGDYQDLTEATDPDYEPAHICGPVTWSKGMDGWVCVDCGVPQLRGFSGHQDSGAVPPAAPATPAGVCAPSEAPPAGPPIMSLDWIEPAFYDVLATHRPWERELGGHYYVYCADIDGTICKRHDDWPAYREHVWDVLRDRLERASKPK